MKKKPKMTRWPPMTQGKKVKLLFGCLSSMSANNFTSPFLGLQQGLWMQSLTSELVEIGANRLNPGNLKLCCACQARRCPAAK